jgi:hypothetical protein
MCIPYHRHSWRRATLLAAIFTTGLLASAIEARAVIIYGSATLNTAPPSEDQGLAGWNLEAQFGNFLATPIDATHFVCAKHVGLAADSVVFQGGTYTVDSTSRQTDDSSDLCIYSITGGAFPTYAPLYNPSIDGPLLGKTLTVIGRSPYACGAGVYVNSNLVGWQWASASGSQSWGQNLVSGTADYTDPQGVTHAGTQSMLDFTFDAPNAGGIANEAILAVGDSSGGVFIQGANGQWKLAGINYATTEYYSYTATGKYPDGSSAVISAAIFDQRGLYEGDSANGPWTLDDATNVDPGYSEDSCISARLGWIESVVPDVVVPEPGTLLMLISAAFSLAVFGRFARRRK